MPYSKTTWQDGVTKLGPTNLNKIENGVFSGYTTYNVKDSAYGATGDGVTDDAAAIQAAVNACSAAGGGVVHFPAGTYALKTYITLASNVMLTGQGRKTTLKLVAGYVSGAQGQGHFFASGASDIIIDSISFDGNSGGIAADAANNFAVWLLNCPRVTIRNCYATGCNSGGSNANAAFLWVLASDYGKAIGNTIENVSGGAIFMQGHNSIVVGNSCASCNDVAIVFNGTNCHNSSAVGNAIETVPSQCAFGVESGTSRWTIIGNTIRACFGALDINDAGYAGSVQPGGIFANNVVTDMDKGASSQTFTCGVLYRTSKSRDIKIVSNIFSGLTPYGATDAFVFVNSATVDRLEITHNVFETVNVAVPAGIIFSTTSAAISRLKITDNRIWSTGASGFGSGIWFANSPTIDTTEISGNTFENVTNGVRFDTPTVNDLTLRDNDALAGVTNLYLTSAWGTISPDVPHIFTKPHGTALFGQEIGYDQITANVTVTGLLISSFTTVIAGTSRTFDGSPIVAEFFAPLVTTPSAAAGNFIAVGLSEGGTVFAVLAEVITPAAANTKVPVLARLRFTPSAGAHTYSLVSWAANTTGTPNVIAGTGTGGGFSPAYLRFTRG
jgi:hypothetical protein